MHARPVVNAKSGDVLVPLVNWGSEANLTNLNVTVALPNVATNGLKPTLATGGAVQEVAPGTYQLALLQIADALILRTAN